MFKGESELNVFNDKTALKQLVDKFSDIRKFDELVEYTKSFEEKSNAAYLKEMRSDDKVSRDAKSLETRIMGVSQKIGDIKRDIRDIETSIEVFSTRLEELEANQETSERYKEIEARRKTQEEKKIKFKALISAVDYNHSLLDRQWILCAFPDILKEFNDKCSALSKEKRKQEKDFDKKQAEELEKKMRENTFTLTDYLEQMAQLKKMGSLESVMAMIPGMGGKDISIDENMLAHTEAIILSMTPKERENPDIINASRKKRIAKGSGTSV
jgi:hypothetical protein